MIIVPALALSPVLVVAPVAYALMRAAFTLV